MEIKKKNNSGATLVELMVYMIVGLIVITAAFQSIVRGTRGYQHGRTVSKVQGDARTGVAVMARDIATMGFKTHFITVPVGAIQQQQVATDRFGYTDTAHVDNIPGITAQRRTLTGNQAAFFFRPNIAAAGGATGFGDTLEFFRIRVNNNGALEARERVVYFLDEVNSQIVRTLQTWAPTSPPQLFPGNWGTATETVVVSNAVAMKFRLGRDGTWTLPSDAWISSQRWDATPTTLSAPDLRRDQVRHVEISILVRANEQSNAPYGVGTYNVGDITYTPPPADNNRVHRIYRQTVEVPSNARPPRP